MYDTSNVGGHIYKMATTCVWRLFGADFLGPLFHQMFPNSKYPNNPRLVLAARILSMVRLAYPRFKPELDQAIAREAKSRHEKAHLQNLKDLCEWFIPKVDTFAFFLIVLWYCHMYTLHIKLISFMCTLCPAVAVDFSLLSSKSSPACYVV